MARLPSRTSAPFDPAVASTYPTQYTKNTGDPIVNLNNNIYAAFVQDQWRPADRLTINLGVRWDYEDVVGIDHDKNNFAPRFGVVWDVNGSGRTVLRANAGIYYDQIFLNIPLNAENAKKFVQTLDLEPGLSRSERPESEPDRRTDHADSQLDAVCAGQPDAVHRADDGRRAAPDWPHVLDFSRPGPRSWLRACCDRATPTIRTWTTRRGPRPNPSFQRITIVETKGNSWYTGLQVGIEKRLSQRHTYTVAYTLSETERNTEDFNFFPMDNRFYDGERGPASNDARHRVSAAFTVQLPWQIQAGTLVAARSKLPYNITTGADDNRDTQTNDRPAGVGRNSGRGASLFQADLRLTKSLRMRGVGVELIGEAFNITNQKNWTNFTGNQRAATFGKPTGGEITRQVQLGVRVDF